MALSGVRVLFAGTPAFAVPSLEALLALDAEVVGVLTQPDRPVGRGRKPRLCERGRHGSDCRYQPRR